MRRAAVIEDNVDNQLVFELMLKDHYAVDVYADGPSALEGMRASRPDVILLDIALPGIAGEEVLELIRADAALRNTPVLAVTAHVLAGERERLLEAGFDAYVSKPIVDLEEFVRTVQATDEAGRA
jgi:two-component system cell cycle response regulator DivK